MDKIFARFVSPVLCHISGSHVPPPLPLILQDTKGATDDINHYDSSGENPESSNIQYGRSMNCKYNIIHTVCRGLHMYEESFKKEDKNMHCEY
jgi:hypothetical protein